PGERTLTLENPHGGRFDYNFVVMGRPNHAPLFTTTPLVDAYAKLPYIYAPAATDPDGDAVTLSLPGSEIHFFDFDNPILEKQGRLSSIIDPAGSNSTGFDRSALAMRLRLSIARFRSPRSTEPMNVR